MNWLTRIFVAERDRPPLTALTAAQRNRLDAWQHQAEADLNAAHGDQRYVVVDVETSGLDMKRDCLISIGAVALVAGRLDFSDAFQVVLRQERVSARENILIHGIGGTAQSGGVEPAEALLAFLEYAGKAPLVAYHAFFDQAMIDKAVRTYLGGKLGRFWIDLAWVLPDFFPFRRDARVALDDWLQHFDIENLLRHHAVSDAYATAKLLQVTLAAAQAKGVNSPASLARIEKARRWMQESR